MAVVTLRPLVSATRTDARWSVHSIHDRRPDGRGLRVLTVVDPYPREARATEARGSCFAHGVIDRLRRRSRSDRKPAVIPVNNGTGSASRALPEVVGREGARLGFRRPGKPTDHAHASESREDAAESSASFRQDSNAVRPHDAREKLAPRELAELGPRSAGRERPELPAARVASVRSVGRMVDGR